MACDMPEPCKFLSFDSCQRRFQNETCLHKSWIIEFHFFFLFFFFFFFWGGNLVRCFCLVFAVIDFNRLKLSGFKLMQNSIMFGTSCTLTALIVHSLCC